MKRLTLNFQDIWEDSLPFRIGCVMLASTCFILGLLFIGFTGRPYHYPDKTETKTVRTLIETQIYVDGKWRHASCFVTGRSWDCVVDEKL